MSARPASALLEVKRAGQASAALSYVELATQHLLNLSYGLATVADQAQVHLQANQSVIGSGLVAITQAVIDGLDDMLGEIQDMKESQEWNPGVRVAAFEEAAP